jgi:hypothetical protein
MYRYASAPAISQEPPGPADASGEMSAGFTLATTRVATANYRVEFFFARCELAVCKTLGY